MKKKLLIFLTTLASLVCLAACNKDASANNPPETPPAGEVVPDFPENDFGKDNEINYPDAWN